MARVLVYTDGGLGASEACVSMTIRELRRALAAMTKENGAFTVETTEADSIKSGELSRNCRLLVMPGGRDLPYCSLLNGSGNYNIRKYVENGGSYMGICAGAYYASSRLEFSLGDPILQVEGSRELGFYPGVARGPVFPGFSYTDNSSARVCSISLAPIGTSLPVYYNGGCCFSQNVSKDYNKLTTNVEVLATYEKTANVDVPLPDGPAQFPDSPPAAVVSMQYGAGKVVLSGVHIESSPAGLTEAYFGDVHVNHLANNLIASENNRNIFFNTIINHLLQ